MKGIVLRIKSPKKFHGRRGDIVYFFKRYGFFTTFLFAILVGMILGIYVGTNTDSDFKKAFDFLFITDFNSRSSFDFLRLFNSFFSPSFLFFISIFLLGFCPWGNALIPVIISFKGFGAGLTLTQLCFTFGIKGLGFFILGIVPGFFIFSAVISAIGEHSFRLSAKVFRVIIRKQDIVLNIKEYVTRSGAFILIVLLSAFIDTILFSALYIHFGI